MGVNSLLQLAQATRRHSQGRGALTAAGVGRHHRHVLGGAHGRTKAAPVALPRRSAARRLIRQSCQQCASSAWAR